MTIIRDCVKTLMSMCTNYLMGGMTTGLFIGNLEVFVKRIREEYESAMDANNNGKE